MTEREVLKLALEALEVNLGTWSAKKKAIPAIKEALAQPEQEPVADQPLPCPFCGHIGLDFSDGNTYRWGIASCGGCGASCGDIRREYPDEGKWHSEAIAEWNRRTTPPQPEPVIDKSAAIRIATSLGWEPKRTWQGLTEKDFSAINQSCLTKLQAATSAESILKEKNT